MNNNKVIRRTCLLVRRSVLYMLGKPACSGFCNTTVLARLFRFHCWNRAAFFTSNNNYSRSNHTHNTWILLLKILSSRIWLVGWETMNYGGPGGRYSRQCCHSSCSHVSRITPAICAAPRITLVRLQWKNFTLSLTARSNRTLILCM